MRKTVVAGMLVAAMVTGAGGIAGAAPAGDQVAGSSDTGSAVIDAVQLGGMLALFMANILSCNAFGSAIGSCTPMGPIADAGSADPGSGTGSVDPGSNFVLSWLLCEVGADVGSANCGPY